MLLRNKLKLCFPKINCPCELTLERVCLFVEGRGSRVTGRGSRVNGRGSRVEGRGSRVEKFLTMFLNVFESKFRVYSSFRFLLTLTPSGIMCFLACSRLSLVETG